MIQKTSQTRGTERPFRCLDCGRRFVKSRRKGIHGMWQKGLTICYFVSRPPAFLCNLLMQQNVSTFKDRRVFSLIFQKKFLTALLHVCSSHYIYAVSVFEVWKMILRDSSWLARSSFTCTAHRAEPQQQQHSGQSEVGSWEERCGEWPNTQWG